MALKAFYTPDEAAAIKGHLDSDAAKALGLELKDDGKGHLLPVIEARDGFALEDVAGLKATVETTRAERGALQLQVKALDGLDPATIPALVEKAKQFDALDPKKEEGKNKDRLETWKGDYTKQVTDAHAAELAVVEGQRDVIKRQLAEELITAKASMILTRPELKGNATLLMPVIRNMTDAVADDTGRMTVRVLNPLKPGEAKVGKTGGDMDLEELIVDEMRPDPVYAACWGVPGKSGAGEGGGGGGGGTQQRSKMSSADKVDFIRANGRDAYHALPE